jgi:hypothetical protein
MLGDDSKCVQLIIALESASDPYHHGRPVVHARLERTTCENKTVEQCHG